MDYESDPGWQYLRRSREEIIKDQSREYDSKKNVWIPDPKEGYIAAEIKATKSNQVTVIVQGGTEKTIRSDEIQEMNPPKFEKTEDMSNLTFLNDASVLSNLRSRYSCMLIYTYSGLFCVVINPYKRLPIYTDSVARMFMGKRRTEMPPHLFAVSDEAYRSMLQNRENQSMLITGESGAGKTENTKKVIAYFASVGASQQEKEAGGASVGAAATGGKRVTLEDQIVQTNPVLEAFGNAKTVRNNNSSRFGKFIRIHFNKTGKVSSCDIEHYLLEKSRVIRQAPGERCYHIFYQIFSGYRPELLKLLLLDKPVKDYYFVAQAELLIDGIDDKEEHQLTDEAFHVLNFSETEINDCYKLVAAMLHMGNMKFKQRPREEQAETDGTDEAEKAAKMYGITSEDFLKALLRPRVKVGSEWVNKGQNMEQVAWSVGAMAKGLYSRIFNWLVKKCNETLTQIETNRDFFIGVLDIAGFEIFDFNSFEQLWINYVNEKLQQFFNHHMFVLEQEEYAKEGIDWVFIDFGLDLQACIELIEKPMGIIAMLDEECIVPKASDNTLAQKLLEQHLGKHPNFEKAKPPKGKQGEAHFGMRHYAGTVRYNVSNWLEKNKDPLNDSLVAVMKSSQSNKLLVEVWSDYTTQEEAAVKSKGGEKSKKKSKSGSFMTVSMIYRESLNNLMTMLNATHPHFIRCIIPNEKKQSGLIDAALVLNQLTCNGVLEGIRICRKGFPNRFPHQDFVQRYALLSPEEAHSAGKDKKDAKGACERMLKRLVKQGDLKDDNFRIFFKAGVVAAIEDFRDNKLSSLLTGLQSQIRWYCAKTELTRRRKQTGGIVVVQHNVRKWLALQTWVWFKLYVKVRPFLVVSKEQEEIDAVTMKLNDIKQNMTKEQETRKKLNDEARKFAAERAELATIIEKTRVQISDAAQRLDALSSAKEHLESNLEEVNGRLSGAEHRVDELSRVKKRIESDTQALKKQISDYELSLRKAEADKQAHQNQMANLVEESHKQEAQLTKLSRERKHQEEIAKKLLEDLKSEKERTQNEKSFRQRLQNALESAESELEREKRQRADGDKAKRKLDGELRIARETLDEALKQRQDAEAALKRKESELFALGMRVEGAQNSGAKLSRQFQEQTARLNDMKTELQTEREARARSERARNDLQSEIDELQEQLEQHSVVTSAQIEANKKRDAEISRVRHEIEQLKTLFDSQCQAAKKKGVDACGELRDQINHLTRQRAKAEKEKAALQRRIHDALLELDDASRERADAERQTCAIDVQIGELRAKSDELKSQVTNLSAAKSRLQSESGDLTRQLDDLEAKIANAARLRAQFSQQADELKRAAGEEAREKQSAKIYAKNLEHELEQIRESLEEEIASKSDLLRQLSREQSDAQQWRVRFESAGLLVDDDADETRRRQIVEIARVQNELDAAVVRLTALERQRSRLAADTEAAHSDADQLAHDAQQLEKQQSAQNKTVDEWRRKADDLQSELDAAQRDTRHHNAELQRVTLAHDQTAEQVDALRRENQQLAQDTHDLQEQLNENSRLAHQSEVALRRLEVEKNELQHALDEAEAALEAEESKVLRSQVEVAQIRAEIEKRLQEKEEEFENVRKNHQNTVETLQSSLDQESKAKAELARAKKKLESDVAEFQLALEHATRANEDAQRNVRRCADQVKELQQQADEDQRKRDEFHERFLMAEKRLHSAKSDFSEMRANFEGLQRTKRQLDTYLSELQLQTNELQEETKFNLAGKSKLESELVALQADLNEARGEVENASKRGKRAAADAAHLAEELHAEQERSNAAERQRKNLEFHLKDIQGKIEDAENLAARGGAKTVAKLEGQLKTIEATLEVERRRHIDSAKAFTKADRRTRELLFQVDEERKKYATLCDLSEKLQTKIKAQRRMLDEAEESANINLQKYRNVQSALDTVQERADNAESTLVHVRLRATRGMTPLSRNPSAAAGMGCGGGLNKSETIA